MNQSERLSISMDNIRKLMQRHQPIMSIPKSEFMVLKFINDETDIKVSDISTKLNISNAAVSQVIASLEAKNLVERKMSSLDRRIIFVSLTKEGITAINDAKVIMNKFMSSVVKNLGEHDSEELIRIITKLETLLKEGDICNEIIN
jgi:DNA-binding MarR family transcriptional regulator